VILYTTEEKFEIDFPKFSLCLKVRTHLFSHLSSFSNFNVPIARKIF